jgi:hypothetical protein
MFVRTATRRNKDGSAVRYVQLVQNEWDPATRSSRMRVVHSFGREDQLDRRIRAHVILCWLALLLIRIAETTAGTTWNKIRRELSQLTLGTFTGPAGTFRQTAELTPAQRDILDSLQIPYPKKIIQAAPATPTGPGENRASA